MDMMLLKERYEVTIRANENRIEYLEKIVEEQKEVLKQKEEIIQQILENNLSESVKLKLFEKAVPCNLTEMKKINF
ncbi:hypothetical protein ACFFIX_18985 [Metabacillus herbersteinensis]|uniref:Uncharacterized protein n=1 Tax=Metabacillus herbersteinensis TaxID=283816 RepID=A0ABV6GIH0_9BACI